MRSNEVVLRSARTIKRLPPSNLTGLDDELFRDAYSYATFDCLLSSIKNARVSANSVVYKMYSPLRNSLYRSDDLGYYRFRYLPKMLLTARKVRLDPARHYLLATDQESNGHFHWFTEVLPRLWLVKERSSDFVLLLEDNRYLRSIAAESLEYLGFQFEDIYWMKVDEFYTVPILHYISKVSLTGQVDDLIMQELNRAFVGDKPGGQRKLYISREHARFRKVLNEAELEDRLEEYGFEIVEPDSWSLSQQIETFSECGTLVAIHGAGLTNCLFMPPGGKVIELRKREPNYGYWHLAESVGHEYYYYHGVPDSDRSLIGRGCNLTIPINDFEQKIISLVS